MPTPIVPPIVLSRQAGGPAYLLEWHQLEGDVWGAEIAWMQWDPGTSLWVGRRAKVMADDLTEVEGQNYKGVPRWTLAQLRRRGFQRLSTGLRAVSRWLRPGRTVAAWTRRHATTCPC